MPPRNHPPLAPRRGRVAPRRAWAALAAILAATALCAGCDAGLAGVYASSSGRGSLEFRRDGSVRVTVHDGTFAGTYRVDGKRVTVDGPNGAQVFTRCGDLLEGGYGTTFVRVPRRAAVETKTGS